MKEDHATKITACASLLAGSALLIGSAGATPLVGGVGDYPAVAVDGGRVVTQTEAVAVSSAANGLAKRGDGTYVLPSDKLLLRDQFTLKTGAGTGEFRFVASGEAPTFSQPDVMAEAAFWVDASRANTLATTVTTNVVANADGSETTNFVSNAETWYDVRDLEAVAAGNAGTHPRAVASRALTFGDGETRVPSVETLDGRAVVNFGCGRTGRYMMWRTPVGGTNRIDGIRHLFAVQCITNSWGYLLGSHTSANGAPGSQNASSLASVKADPLWSSANHAICAGRTFQNGVAVDGYTAKARLGFHLLEFVTSELAVDGSDCFFSDHDYQASATTGGQSGGGDRVGGDFLSEVLVFTNRLTEAQRMAIEAHLMAKWRLQAEAPDVTLVTKDGTTTRLSTDGTACDASVVGNGRLEVTGDATAYLQPMTDDRLVVASSPVTPRGGTAGSDNAPVHSTAAQDTAAFAGEARLAGVAYVNTPVPLALEAGETVTANQDAAGLCVRVTADAKADALVKRGRGEVSLARIPAAVRTLSVQEGVLRLVAPGRPTGVEAGANAGVEAVFSSTDWANAETGATVTVPADGVYELSFSCRRDGAQHNQPLYLDVVLSSDAMKATTVGRVVCVETKPTRFYRFRTPRLTAGAYALALKPKSAVAAAETSGAQFDGFRMVCVADETETSNVLANGDFEDFAWPLAAPGFSAAVGNAATGWKFEQAADRLADALPSVALVTPGAMDAVSCFWDALGYRHGAAAVCFCKPGGTLTRTNLTLAAGAYRVRARLARQRHPYGSAGTAAAVLTATVTPQGGTPIALGSVTQVARTATDVMWPGGFALAEPTAVDLAFTQTADTILIADDFEIVPARDLLANGGFEQDVSTTSDAGNWMSEGDSVARGWYENENHDKIFTQSYFAGTSYMRIRAAGLVRQQVAFPAAGVYRLTLHGHARHEVGSSAFFGNPVRAWWLQPQADGTVVTNEIGRTSFDAQDEQSRNFLRFSWDFRVPKAGTYVLGLQGTGIRDATTLVDDVSLAWIDEDQVEAAPLADPELELRVATGAKVRLDYPGALTVRKLYLGGKRVRATACDADGNRTVTVSAVDYPDFFTGPGSVTVSIPSRGVLFILR